jgi:16S rRNA (cytosine1402-N4)-methyltransferase
VLLRGNFGEIASLRSSLPVPAFDIVLADLGVSSPQLDEARRGFSFRRDGPLDMRMDPSRGESAAEYLQRIEVGELARVIAEYGEERHARRIAEEIVRIRGGRPIRTTHELAELVRRVVPRRHEDGIDSATRTFQAIRIAVNGELAALDHWLAHFDPLLSPGGRFAVISYHSLEDRRVKNAFRARAAEGDHELVTPRAVRPGAEEVARNPRARSARLRVLRRRGGRAA